MKFKLPEPDTNGMTQEEIELDIWHEFDPTSLDFDGVSLQESLIHETLTKCDPAGNLKNFRKRLGLTQADMAEKTGVSRRAYQDLEAGRTSMNADFMLQLYARFGLDTHALLTGTEPQIRQESKELLAKKAIGALCLMMRLYQGSDHDKIVAWAIKLAANGNPSDEVTIQDIWTADVPEEL
ncbi:helix-turn-helix domain-containing protein [uncultured Litoreibacter sp.]|uniref:helix-turn-helix domain-containing protein n=1 Tax=uncultured Litoreibacter sp. TaxID=1392394 RepID=UPI0026270BC0|nr:helix-turn-helix transcriptional regulator [uncultured Litoreibacter sp.]